MLMSYYQPKVSAIIPTYNRAESVVKAIESVINQTYNNIEIIVVDDGSIDNTSDTITRFGSIVHYFKKDNGGVSSARNLGISHSNGELIAFLDSDDTWLPDKIQKQVDYLFSHQNFGMVLCDCFFVDDDGNCTGQSNRRTSLPHDGNVLKDVIIAPSLIPSSLLVKTKLLQQVGLFDENLRTAEDLDLHLKLARITNIGLLAEPLFNYKRGCDGLSMLSCTYDDHVKVIERFISCHKSELELATIRYALFKVYKEATRGKIWLNEWSDTIKYANKLFSTTSFIDLKDVLNLIFVGLYCFFKSKLKFNTKIN